MVSTRLMSTTSSSNAGNSPAADETARLSVVTRQTSSNYVLVNCSTMPTSSSSSASSSSSSVPTHRQQQPQQQNLSTPSLTLSSTSSMSSSTGSSTTTTTTIMAATASSARQSQLTQAVRATHGNSGSSSSTSSNNTLVVAAATSDAATPAAPTQIELLDLPEEILSKIFAYVGYKKIGQMRVVSQKMNDVCMHVLNSTFSKLITQTFKRFHEIKANMPRRESARRNHPLACECDIIETCYMRLSLLQMTFGKHIERGHCCFFPGAILDEVYTILNYIKNTPRLERPYRVTDELFDLSTMAMEYFRDRIESTLPDIAYFNKDFFKLHTTKRPALVIASDLSDSSSSLPSPPQSNMVLRKGIRKIKQGMKIYNNQLSVLRNELRTCKRKANEQSKQIAEQQKLLAEQQKQSVEYANRLDENDKKNEEMSRKFSTLLQELNKCKTELQYWRSKSPAIPICTSCGQKVTPMLPPEDYQALINQGVKPEDIINDETDAESDASMSEHNLSLSGEFVFPDETTTAKLLAVSTATKNLKRQNTSSSSTTSNTNTSTTVGGCGANMAHSHYEEEMPSTSTKVQQRSHHHHPHYHQSQPQHVISTGGGGGKLSEMTSSLDYAINQNIIKTICTPTPTSATPTTSKDLNNAHNLARASTVTGCDTYTSNKDTVGINGGDGVGGGVGVVENSHLVGGGYPTSLFYGTQMHKGVIVSPSMLAAKNEAILNGQPIGGTVHNEGAAAGVATAAATVVSTNATSNDVVATADGVEDVANLYAITSSNETKKARRVQKATRCSNGSGKRSK